MRPLILVLLASLIAAPAAEAAPTCQDRHGDTIRCGVEGAMPVGWTAPPDVALARENSSPSDSVQALEAGCIVALFLAFIALLPEFDGTRSSDWGKQEGDDDPDGG